VGNHDEIMDEFHKLDKEIAIVKESAKTIIYRLDTLNGSVARHAQEIEDNRKQISGLQIKSAGMGAGGAGLVGIIIFVLNKLGLI